MSILSRDVSLPLFMCIEEGASNRLGALLLGHNLRFAHPLFITGGPVLQKKAETISRSLDGNATLLPVRESTIEEAERIMERIEADSPDVVVGVGGGRVLDLAKYTASEKGLPFISVPGAVSNDGIASPVAVIRFNGRTKSLQAHIPMAVVADPILIESAPQRTLQSGIGDLISTLSACADWRLAVKRGRENGDEFTETISRNAAMRVLLAGQSGPTGRDFLKVLIEGLIMSGIAMGICGSSRPSSGAEHMISHAIDRHFDKKQTHGEQVGVATLFTLQLHGEELSHVRALFRRFGLPLSPTDLGLTQAEFLHAVHTAPQERPGRYSILNETLPEQLEEAYHAAFK